MKKNSLLLFNLCLLIAVLGQNDGADLWKDIQEENSQGVTKRLIIQR